MSQIHLFNEEKKVEINLGIYETEKEMQKIPCKRACRIIDGKIYLIHSANHQDQILRKYWQNPERPGCEHCGKAQRIIGFYMRLYGLCDDCYAKSRKGECDDFVII